MYVWAFYFDIDFNFKNNGFHIEANIIISDLLMRLAKYKNVKSCYSLSVIGNQVIFYINRVSY